MIADQRLCHIPAPVFQAKRAARENSAPETDSGPKLRVNEQITAPFVRLVFPEGGHQVRERRLLHILVAWHVF